MVTRLAAADAMALNLQTPTTPAHTVAVLVLEASTPLSHRRLARWAACALPRLARFRSRLVDKPLVGQPLWAEIDDYDPTPQIHAASVVAPGGNRELGDLITLVNGPLADPRALWEAWSIDGLAGGRWALAVRMSPVLSDEGRGVAAMWECLTTGTPGASGGPVEPGLGPAPSSGQLLTDTVSEFVENQLTGMWTVTETVTGALPSLGRRLRAGPARHTEAAAPVPATPFNTPMTTRRALAFASIPAGHVQHVSLAFGANTATVVLAACTLSLRAWLRQHDRMPSAPLTMTVPLSAPAGDPATNGGPAAMGRVHMPVHLDDPVQVLTDLHTATERLNIASRDEITDATVDVAEILSLFPPWAVRATAQVYRGLGVAGWRGPRCHGSISFVGTRTGPVFCSGAQVAAMYVAEPLVDRRGLDVTVTPHGDVIDLCVGVCPDTVPDVDGIATGMTAAIDELCAAAGRTPRGEGRSVVTEMTSHVSRRSRT
ncbi:DUF1298 domain-containing protein [Mycobacterium sp. PS03-16]|uniref:wax ester/triacylglycerol synthase domain-containing protein n=1 Tax=Mycobacterium sp. PS03-16 TaxID=2559611 RepID=UPI0010739F82|nr:wax ester/triacylglycerol synthase domain-containing protein [Mycobacterium sp. PS03-16]TFV61485.1 DUF1298 domain-containing protein [Mycobacterium sp. PS03-16]